MRKLAALLMISLGGCDFATSNPAWQEQLSPEGPCYEANMLDGFDESSTEELHQVFACLNQTGALRALEPLDQALDGDTRDGTVGYVLAVQANKLSGSSFSIPSLLSSVRDLLNQREEWGWVLHVGLELLYGAPYDWLGRSVELNSQTELDRGLLTPLSSTLGVGSAAILDDDYRALQPVEELLRSERLPQLAWTVSAIGQSTNPTLSTLNRRWAFDVADALEKAGDTSNNRLHQEDSLRALVVAMVGNFAGRPRISRLSDPLLPLLDDPIVEAGLREWLSEAEAEGRLQNLPGQLADMARKDAQGNYDIGPSDSSALTALVRLLHAGNRDVSCEGNILGFPIEISLGNLSVQLLELISTWNPNTAISVVELLGGVLDVDWLTGPLLDLVPDVCSGINQQMIDDLYAIERLNDSPGLSRSLILLLRAMDGHIPDMVNLLDVAYQVELLPPVEEALIDLADASLVLDLLTMVPVLLEPDDYFDAGYFPFGVDPLSFEDVWEILGVVLPPDQHGLTPLDRLGPPLQAALAQEGTWTAMANLGRLLGESEAELPTVLTRLDAILQEDPSLSWAHDAADLLADHETIRPLLVLVESDALRGAAFRTELTAEGPLPWFARLQVGGTLDVLLNTISSLLTLLPEEG